MQTRLQKRRLRLGVKVTWREMSCGGVLFVDGCARKARHADEEGAALFAAAWSIREASGQLRVNQFSRLTGSDDHYNIFMPTLVPQVLLS
jgi:hypothetical protein